MNALQFWKFGEHQEYLNKEIFENIYLENTISFPNILKNNGIGIHNEFGQNNFKKPTVSLDNNKKVIIEYDINLYKSDFVDSFDWEFEYQNRDILDLYMYHSLEECTLFHYPQNSVWFCHFMSVQYYDNRGNATNTKVINTYNKTDKLKFVEKHLATNNQFEIVVRLNSKRITELNYEKQTYIIEGYFTLEPGKKPQAYQLRINFKFHDSN